ncbi:hypothetical protein LTR17_000567 [Elasticomyces elasticus]|nr:hypothetical protein LTR17_000567 [Elasticomyces elasticus]
MVGHTPSNATDGLQSILSKVCRDQSIEWLTRTIDELTKERDRLLEAKIEDYTELDLALNDTNLITEAQSFTNGKDVAHSTSSELAVVAMPSAGKRLTDTYELLEMILLHLPEEALLCNAQRVSKHFRDTIKRYKPLQRKLFFAPLLPGAVPDDRPLRINPLLSKVAELPLYYCPTSRRLRYRGGPERHQIRLEKPKSTTEYVPQVGTVNDGADVEWVEVPVVA